MCWNRLIRCIKIVLRLLFAQNVQCSLYTHNFRFIYFISWHKQPNGVFTFSFWVSIDPKIVRHFKWIQTETIKSEERKEKKKTFRNPSQHQTLYPSYMMMSFTRLKNAKEDFNTCSIHSINITRTTAWYAFVSQTLEHIHYTHTHIRLLSRRSLIFYDNINARSLLLKWCRRTIIIWYANKETSVCIVPYPA